MLQFVLVAPLDLLSLSLSLSLCARHAERENISRAVFYTLPVDVANELAYVPDQMILDFLFTKVTMLRMTICRTWYVIAPLLEINSRS